MKVVVTNTALLNTGDAAIMLGTCAVLERAFGPDLEISVRDQQPAVAGRHYREFAARPLLYDRVATWTGDRRTKHGILLLLLAALLRRVGLAWAGDRLLPADLRADVAELAAADLIVAAGGTYLVPHYRVSPKLLELLVARCLGRPYVLFTQSLGPFAGSCRGWLVRRLLRDARLVMVRDGRSRGHLEAIGVAPDRILECADAAFALPPPYRPPHVRRNPPQVAVSVRDWPHFAGDADAGMDRYLDAIAAVVGALVETHGAKVTFLSTCQGIAQYWTDDAGTADAVVARLPANVRASVQVNRDFHRPEDLAARLGGFDMVVATRMHVAILALCAGTPVLPIAYEFKTRELFAHLGLGELVQDIEDVSADGLRAAVEALLADCDAVRTTMHYEVDALRRSALGAARPLAASVAEAA